MQVCEEHISNLTVNLNMKCNMHCSYCYVYSQEVPEQVKQDEITLEQIEQLLMKYAECVNEDSGLKILDISWHGGEPLMRGKEFFLKLMELQKKLYNSHKIFVRNRIQTNGTLIDNEWAEFFRKYNFTIGVSLDGPIEYHDLNRYYCNHKSSFMETMRGIEILKAQDVSFGILSVITNPAVNQVNEIYQFFKSLNVKSVDFLPSYLPGGGENVNVDPVKWGEFLIKIFDIWKEDLSFEIGYLSNIVQKAYSLEKNEEMKNSWLLCEFSSECGNNLSLTPDGDLFFCECLIGLNEYRLGNVYESGMKKLLESERNIKRKKEFNVKSKTCLTCDMFKICQGGCVKHKTSYLNRYQMGNDIFCISKKMIISYILQNMRGGKYEKI